MFCACLFFRGCSLQNVSLLFQQIAGRFQVCHQRLQEVCVPGCAIESKGEHRKLALQLIMISWLRNWHSTLDQLFSISGFSPHALAMLANASVQACFWMRPLLGKAPRLQLALKGHSLDQWHENGTEKSNLPSFCSWSALCGLLLPGLLPDQSKRFRLFRCLCWGSKVSC